MLVLACLVAVISVVAGVVGIIGINILPKEADPIRKNYRMVVLYSTISPGVDILFTASILLSIPYGTYSIAEGLLIGIVIAVIFTPFCLISSYRLQKRMSQLKEEIVKDNWMGRINCLNYCPIFKFIFFLFWGILVFGVGYF